MMYREEVEDLTVEPMPSVGEPQEVERSNGAVRFLRALPGGERATGEEYMVAAIILVALLGLWAFRKGLRPGEGHVHVGTADVMTSAMTLVIVHAFIRTALSQPRFAETKLGKALAWLWGE